MRPRKPLPKYKQPLPNGLTSQQIKSALVKRTKTAQTAVERHANKKASRRWAPGVRTKEWIERDRSLLYKWLQESRFHENQVVAEKLARIIDAVWQEEMVIPEGQQNSFWAIFDRLRKAEGSQKQVSLTPQQTSLLDKFVDMV